MLLGFVGFFFSFFDHENRRTGKVRTYTESDQIELETEFVGGRLPLRKNPRSQTSVYVVGRDTWRNCF